MINLIIAFLISLGWTSLSDSSKSNVSIVENPNNRFGIVILDEIQQKITINLVYDPISGTFKVE